MSKNALIILAHPEQNSLNHSLMNESIKILEAKGYKVKTSDLYKMNFNPLLTSNDFKDWPANIPMNLMLAAGKSNESKKLSTDILEEQSKVEWADLVIFQFPLWWMSMPAILKGWFDRSISAKFAYGNKPQIPENSKLANKKDCINDYHSCR
ncbi:hypothetical protein TBLA_0D02050 [Henningerozyma blattae CBS 6284]|uniref:Flavodoxin-like fold domain-containing protein n=1 Tax=Henningerozyma blattae (strain ATCC 34711 / CBS 6284 / DSM 70876 / NBRC 10599 / NRRL Y-10934 / UCD 77-7) TaxID=1071380 RepID=I2H2W0_HENB6|nr:hypothetical protein TBLA_0D02050 [Tetrapisispora blattae CBS 6284]CCH60712.1 hypothetical protein TBLA_0D02050 [Tetrapisispora blattae CBS 6284]